MWAKTKNEKAPQVNMNLLVVSRTPWSVDNSFGNTFSNLFSGMKDIEIYHICCQKGETNGSLAKKTIQFTDSSVLHCFFGDDAAKKIYEKTKYTEKDISETISSRRYKDNVIFHIIRDAIWLICPWKKSCVLNTFLNENKIDLLYLPVYASCYMCDIQLEIIKRLNVPVVVHISDDIYRENGQQFRGLLGAGYQRNLQKKIREIIAQCEYIDVFAENMIHDYERLFHRKCYLIGKGVLKKDIPLKPCRSIDRNVIVYTGGLGTGRFKVIANLARCIDKKRAPFVIHIYSPDTLEGEIQKAFEGYKCVKYMGRVSGEDALKAQREAGFLLYVESFSKEMIETTRMSFSTKIIDYLMTGNPILAIGPNDINSIIVLQEKELAYVVDSIDEIDHLVDDLIFGKIDAEAQFERVKRYLMNERDIEKIQTDMRNRMELVCQVALNSH